MATVAIDLRALVMRAIPETGLLVFLVVAAAAIDERPSFGADRESALNQILASCLKSGHSPELCARLASQSSSVISRGPDVAGADVSNPPQNSSGARIGTGVGGGFGLLLILRFIFRRIFASGVSLLLLPVRRSREQARRRDAESTSFAGKLRAAAADDDYNQAIDAMIAAAITRSAPTPPSTTASTGASVPNAVNQQPRTFGRRVAAG
jgi:hypothetical protein